MNGSGSTGASCHKADTCHCHAQQSTAAGSARVAADGTSSGDIDASATRAQRPSLATASQRGDIGDIWIPGAKNGALPGPTLGELVELVELVFLQRTKGPAGKRRQSHEVD